MNVNNDESNTMSKYFIHQNQAETIPEQSNNHNQININTTNSQMNSSFESIMTSQTNLNNEIMNDLIGVEAPDKKIIKILRVFKKNIKLRNATIKKNFWKREYINNNTINIKISSLFPLIFPSQGFCLCLYNYMSNKQFKELICRVENEIIVNSDNINNNNFDIIENYSMINQEENQMNNLLINPIAYLDNNKHRKELMKLISSIYPRLKSLKNELGKSKENYIFNYLVIKSKLINQKSFIYGKLYSIFPNINFQLREIQKLSLSSKFKLNKLLISKRHTNIENEKGVLLKNGFITMSSEKRIITLTDDTNKKELQESQSLKQIIFGIWLSLKQEEVTNYPNIETLIYKHRHFIYRKCLEFILASPKIETIYSPSPDQGIFLLIIFFKTSQCYLEVKIIPNEEEKFFVRDENENETFNNEINNDDALLEKFGNQWLIKTQKFDLGNNSGQFFFDFNRYKNKIKIDTVNNFINRHLNKNNSNNMNSMNNFNKSSRNNYINNNYQYNMNMNTFPNSNINYNQDNNQYMMMTDINNNNNNFEGSNSGFGYTSQGFKDSKNMNNNNISNSKNKFRASQSQKNIIENNSHKSKEKFDPLTDIFEKNNSNNNSNNNIPIVNNTTNINNNNNKIQNQKFTQNIYNNNINNNINLQNKNTEYNPNEYLKIGQNNNNTTNNTIENNNKVLNNIGSVYGDIEEDTWFNQSNFSKGLNFPYSNKPNTNPQNMFGQIMMNNNINILNNINNNNNINNSAREEISQQSNTNYSQYTLGKKIYSNNCSNNGSKLDIKEKEKDFINNITNNINDNSNKNLNQINPNLNIDNKEENNNKYIQYNKYMNNDLLSDKNILKEEKGTQTDDIEKDNKNQIQGLNTIIMEQSKSIQMLQNKVNNLEELLAKVNFLLKQRQKNYKDKENDIINNDRENENNENNDNNEIGESINKSESLKNSENNVNNKNIFSYLNQNNINNNINQNNNYNINNINNNKNIINNINNVSANKLNEETSNDNLYKIKNSSNSNFVDSNNKLIMGKNKGVYTNEESLDNELSSDLNISDSRNSKELNKSNNVGDKTIEIPKIKYNSTLLNSNNDETENDISSN